MMDFEKLIEAVRLCGSTPKADQCKQCAYWSGGKMRRPDQVTRENSPCKGCAERHEACWGMCEKYKAWKARLDEVNKRRKEYSQKPFVKYNPYDY